MCLGRRPLYVLITTQLMKEGDGTVYRDQFKTCFCGAALRKRRFHAYSMRVCETCSGAWVEHGDLTQILQIMADPGHYGEPLNIEEDLGDGGRACLVCRRAMHRVDVKKQILDRCTDHGIWFDRGEFADVLFRYAMD